MAGADGSAAQKTATGIFLPQSATSTPLPEATVIATGPGAPDKNGNIVPTQVKAGDRVLLPGWGGNSIKVGDEVRGGFLPCFAAGAGDADRRYRSTTSSRTRTSLRRFGSRWAAERCS